MEQAAWKTHTSALWKSFCKWNSFVTESRAILAAFAITASSACSLSLYWKGSKRIKENVALQAEYCFHLGKKELLWQERCYKFTALQTRLLFYGRTKHKGYAQCSLPNLHFSSTGTGNIHEAHAMYNPTGWVLLKVVPIFC